MVMLGSDGDQAKVTSTTDQGTTGLEIGAVLTMSDRKTVFSTRAVVSILGGQEAAICATFSVRGERL
jgi:hypothetical protein